MRHVLSILSLSALSLSALTLCACSSDSTTPSDDPGASTGGSGASGGSGGSSGVGGDAAPQDGPSVDEDAHADSEPEVDATSPDAGPLDPGVDPAELAQEDAWYCGRAQREVESFSITTLPNSLIDVQTEGDLEAFKWSKPEVSGGKAIVRSYRPLELERGSVYAQAWCKMKTQAAIQDGLSVVPDGPSNSCKLMNEAAIAWALDHVSAPMKQAWTASGIAIEHVDDEVFAEGSKWIPATMVIERKDAGTIRMGSAALRIDMDIPVLGRVHYCKVLSPEGAVALVADVANGVGIGSDGTEFPIGTEGYSITPTTTTTYAKGFVAHLDAGGDDVDVYVPLTAQPTPLPAAVYMQGGKVDKIHYRNFSRIVAAHGLVVAVANHDSLTGANMTEQSVFNEVWAALKASTQDASSPLHGRIDPTKVAVMGHSLGGVAALAILANKCSPPLCLLGYDAPPELAAGVLYGTNTKTPVIGTFQSYDLRNLPTLFVQGAIDGKAGIDDGLATYEDHVTGNPRGFVTVDGANHYGITDANNPPGADADPNPPTLDQAAANETVARWSAMFLLAHLLGDAEAEDYVYGGTGDVADSNATIDVKP